MNDILKKRKELKAKLKKRERLFGGWVSYAHPSITETFAQADFDFISIDMENSTISVSISIVIVTDARPLKNFIFSLFQVCYSVCSCYLFLLASSNKKQNNK